MACLHVFAQTHTLYIARKGSLSQMHSHICKTMGIICYINVMGVFYINVFYAPDYELCVFFEYFLCSVPVICVLTFIIMFL